MSYPIKLKRSELTKALGRKVGYKEALRAINREHDLRVGSGSTSHYLVKPLPGGRYGKGSLK